MASITVRPVAGRNTRASLLCMPQSSAPHPLIGNGSCRAGTEAAKREPSVRSSRSGVAWFLPSRPGRLGPGRSPERVEQAVFGDVEQAPVDLAPGRVVLVVGRRGGRAGFEGGRPAAERGPRLGQVR